jgi:type VI secretion system secreted protein Hcp
MAFDAFIKIDGIDGESTDGKHNGWIELLSCGVTVAQKVSESASTAGGASSERADFTDFSLVKQIDSSSPKLTLSCAAGTHINNIVIDFCRAGTEKTKFMEYRLSNCIISKVEMVAQGEFPVEKVTINFGKIQWAYTKQNRQGGGAMGNIAAGWDRQRNCQV